MVDEFRAAFQELINASVATDPQHFPPAVRKVYLLASQIPAAERELALEALTPLLAGDQAAPGIIADLSVVAGALVEMGTDPGPTGVEVLRRLRTMGRGAIVFVRAWEHTGGGTPPDPEVVTADAENRVATTLGTDAPGATMCWWTIRRHGLAAKTMLSEPGVRAHIRRDPALHAELLAIADQLSDLLAEFEELHALLRMAQTTRALVMDRDSRRAFRVLFDGIGDNSQLHTLLADALIGPHGQGLPGDPPDPRWVAAFRDHTPDPAAQTVRGWWNLVAHDGTWVWNEGIPAEIPTVDGEHLLILDEQPYPRSWSAGRRHPHVHAWLEVESELTPDEADLWWKRVAPAEPAIPSTHEDTEHPPLPEAITLTNDDTPAPERTRAFLPEEEDRASTPPPESAPTQAVPHPQTNAPTQRPEPHRAPQPAPEPTGGNGLLPPLPPGVSKSANWGPTWR
ncbi:hypothetical protein [Nocardiopsis halotolerans]|uniref:hypothetical protein n=1 Tax=Nocardiopsis halotolerans TaxID=124252 RepID=UPI000347624A|nr:hypothetical protein [Nocardiopsis halotolerans]